MRADGTKEGKSEGNPVGLTEGGDSDVGTDEMEGLSVGAIVAVSLLNTGDMVGLSVGPDVSTVDVSSGTDGGASKQVSGLQAPHSSGWNSAILRQESFSLRVLMLNSYL